MKDNVHFQGRGDNILKTSFSRTMHYPYVKGVKANTIKGPYYPQEGDNLLTNILVMT